MIVIDSHTHTKYSFDSNAQPEEMIGSAITLGIKNLCFTEHLDVDQSNHAVDFSHRFDNYFEELYLLRKKYSSKIEIIIGLEAGWGEYSDVVGKLIQKYPFEYVINSIHVHEGTDYYLSENYDGVDKIDVYEQYLQIVYDSLFAPYSFDAIGHLGYPSRFSPYKNNAFCYTDHKEAFQKIFETLIQKQIILEVNTSVYRSSHNFLASEEMLREYYNLGGRLITFSSDAHSPASLARNYKETIAKLKSIGFSYLTKSKNGNKEVLPI